MYLRVKVKGENVFNDAFRGLGTVRVLTVMIGQSIRADSGITWLAQLLRGCNVALQCDVGLQPRNPIFRSIYYLRLSSPPQFHPRKEYLPINSLPINFRGKSVTLVSTDFHAIVEVFV